MSLEDGWHFVDRGGKVEGPLPLAELRHLLQSGTVTHETSVHHPLMGWRWLGHVLLGAQYDHPRRPRYRAQGPPGWRPGRASSQGAAAAATAGAPGPSRPAAGAEQRTGPRPATGPDTAGRAAGSVRSPSSRPPFVFLDATQDVWVGGGGARQFLVHDSEDEEADVDKGGAGAGRRGKGMGAGAAGRQPAARGSRYGDLCSGGQVEDDDLLGGYLRGQTDETGRQGPPERGGVRTGRGIVAQCGPTAAAAQQKEEPPVKKQRREGAGHEAAAAAPPAARGAQPPLRPPRAPEGRPPTEPHRAAKESAKAKGPAAQHGPQPQPHRQRQASTASAAAPPPQSGQAPHAARTRPAGGGDGSLEGPRGLGLVGPGAAAEEQEEEEEEAVVHARKRRKVSSGVGGDASRPGPAAGERAAPSGAGGGSDGGAGRKPRRGSIPGPGAGPGPSSGSLPNRRHVAPGGVGGGAVATGNGAVRPGSGVGSGEGPGSAPGGASAARPPPSSVGGRTAPAGAGHLAATAGAADPGAGGAPGRNPAAAGTGTGTGTGRGDAGGLVPSQLQQQQRQAGGGAAADAPAGLREEGAAGDGAAAEPRQPPQPSGEGAATNGATTGPETGRAPPPSSFATQAARQARMAIPLPNFGSFRGKPSFLSSLSLSGSGPGGPTPGEPPGRGPNLKPGLMETFENLPERRREKQGRQLEAVLAPLYEYKGSGGHMAGVCILQLRDSLDRGEITEAVTVSEMDTGSATSVGHLLQEHQHQISAMEAIRDNKPAPVVPLVVDVSHHDTLPPPHVTDLHNAALARRRGGGGSGGAAAAAAAKAGGVSRGAPADVRHQDVSPPYPGGGGSGRDQGPDRQPGPEPHRELLRTGSGRVSMEGQGSRGGGGGPPGQHAGNHLGGRPSDGDGGRSSNGGGHAGMETPQPPTYRVPNTGYAPLSHGRHRWPRDGDCSGDPRDRCGDAGAGSSGWAGPRQGTVAGAPVAATEANRRDGGGSPYSAGVKGDDDGYHDYGGGGSSPSPPAVAAAVDQVPPPGPGVAGSAAAPGDRAQGGAGGVPATVAPSPTASVGAAVRAGSGVVPHPDEQQLQPAPGVGPPASQPVQPFNPLPPRRAPFNSVAPGPPPPTARPGSPPQRRSDEGAAARELSPATAAAPAQPSPPLLHHPKGPKPQPDVQPGRRQDRPGASRPQSVVPPEPSAPKPHHPPPAAPQPNPAYPQPVTHSQPQPRSHQRQQQSQQLQPHPQPSQKPQHPRLAPGLLPPYAGLPPGIGPPGLGALGAMPPGLGPGLPPGLLSPVEPPAPAPGRSAPPAASYAEAGVQAPQQQQPCPEGSSPSASASLPPHLRRAEPPHEVRPSAPQAAPNHHYPHPHPHVPPPSQSQAQPHPQPTQRPQGGSLSAGPDPDTLAAGIAAPSGAPLSSGAPPGLRQPSTPLAQHGQPGSGAVAAVTAATAAVTAAAGPVAAAAAAPSPAVSGAGGGPGAMPAEAPAAGAPVAPPLATAAAPAAQGQGALPGVPAAPAAAAAAAASQMVMAQVDGDLVSLTFRQSSGTGLLQQLEAVVKMLQKEQQEKEAAAEAAAAAGAPAGEQTGAGAAAAASPLSAGLGRAPSVASESTGGGGGGAPALGGLAAAGHQQHQRQQAPAMHVPYVHAPQEQLGAVQPHAVAAAASGATAPFIHHSAFQPTPAPGPSPPPPHTAPATITSANTAPLGGAARAMGPAARPANTAQSQPPAAQSLPPGVYIKSEPGLAEESRGPQLPPGTAGDVAIKLERADEVGIPAADADGAGAAAAGAPNVVTLRLYPMRLFLCAPYTPDPALEDLGLERRPVAQDSIVVLDDDDDDAEAPLGPAGVSEQQGGQRQGEGEGQGEAGRPGADEAGAAVAPPAAGGTAVNEAAVQLLYNILRASCITAANA